jgi:hypothetical protein
MRFFSIDELGNDIGYPDPGSGGLRRVRFVPFIVRLFGAGDA